MKNKSIVILFIIIIILSIIIISFLFIYNKTNNEYVIFPNKLEIISSNNVIGYAKRRVIIWQYPTENESIGQISTSLQSPEAEFSRIRNFLNDNDSLKSSNTIFIDISKLNNKYKKEISNINLTLFNEQGETIISKNVETNVNNDKIQINLENLNINEDYYIQLQILYPYNSLIEYNFKLTPQNK